MPPEAFIPALDHCGSDVQMMSSQRSKPTQKTYPQSYPLDLMTQKREGRGGGEIQAISWWNFCTPSPSSRSGQSLKSTSGNRRSSKNCKVRGKSGVVKLYLRQASLHGQDLCTTKRRHLRATALRERHSHFCAQRPSHFHFHQRAQ